MSSIEQRVGLRAAQLEDLSPPDRVRVLQQISARENELVDDDLVFCAALLPHLNIKGQSELGQLIARRWPSSDLGARLKAEQDAEAEARRGPAAERALASLAARGTATGDYWLTMSGTAEEPHDKGDWYARGRGWRRQVGDAYCSLGDRE